MGALRGGLRGGLGRSRGPGAGAGARPTYNLQRGLGGVWGFLGGLVSVRELVGVGVLPLPPS